MAGTDRDRIERAPYSGSHVLVSCQTVPAQIYPLRLNQSPEPIWPRLADLCADCTAEWLRQADDGFILEDIVKHTDTHRHTHAWGCKYSSVCPLQKTQNVLLKPSSGQFAEFSTCPQAMWKQLIIRSLDIPVLLLSLYRPWVYTSAFLVSSSRSISSTH